MIEAIVYGLRGDMIEAIVYGLLGVFLGLSCTYLPDVWGGRYEAQPGLWPGRAPRLGQR